jgi:hypothetical protein
MVHDKPSLPPLRAPASPVRTIMPATFADSFSGTVLFARPFAHFCALKTE